MSGQKLWPKTKSKSGNMKLLSFLAITLWPIIELSCSLAQMKAFDVGNRMIYGLAGFDQIYFSYGQSSANIWSANVATRNTLKIT